MRRFGDFKTVSLPVLGGDTVRLYEPSLDSILANEEMSEGKITQFEFMARVLYDCLYVDASTRYFESLDEARNVPPHRAMSDVWPSVKAMMEAGEADAGKSETTPSGGSASN